MKNLRSCRSLRISCFILYLGSSLWISNSTVGVSAQLPPINSATTSSEGVKSGVREAINRVLSPFTVQPADLKQHATLARSMESVIQRLYTARKELVHLWPKIVEAVHWQDVAMFAALGWLTMPIIQLPYNTLASFSTSKNDNHKTKSVPYHQFKDSVLYAILNNLQQIARIAFAVYIVDIIKMTCIGLGFNFAKMSRFPHAFAYSAYTLWACNRLRSAKRTAIRLYVNLHPETFGRMQIAHRLADAILYASATLVLLNILQVEMGVAMQSFLAFGGVGTLAIGFASQGIAKEILNGLMLASSDRIYEGDTVSFGGSSPIKGTIIKLGWMETIVRASDGVHIVVPNTDLSRQQVSNLSRVRTSQVEQVLRLRPSSSCLQRLPSLIRDIKDEIEASCPQLITDGSLPYRVHWTNWDANSGCIEITINTHHRIKPTGDEYYENRQAVLFAIHRAVEHFSPYVRHVERYPSTLSLQSRLELDEEYDRGSYTLSES